MPPHPPPCRQVLKLLPAACCHRSRDSERRCPHPYARSANTWGHLPFPRSVLVLPVCAQGPELRRQGGCNPAPGCLPRRQGRPEGCGTHPAETTKRRPRLAALLQRGLSRLHPEEAGERQQWPPDKPQRRLPGDKPMPPGGDAPFNQARTYFTRLPPSITVPTAQRAPLTTAEASILTTAPTWRPQVKDRLCAALCHSATHGAPEQSRLR